MEKDVIFSILILYEDLITISVLFAHAVLHFKMSSMMNSRIVAAIAQ